MKVFENRIIKIIFLGLLVIIMVMGCAHKDNTHSVSKAKMEGMEHLYADNTHGYYFDVYSEKSRNKSRTGVIELTDSNDSIYCMIENAGSARKIALQFFIDYVQVPIIIEGKEYFTYYFEADNNFSKEIECQFAQEFDEREQHKLLAAMTVSADIHASDFDSNYTSDQYSITYDMTLDFANSENLSKNLCAYTAPEKESSEQWSGILINAEHEELKRSLPDKEIICNPGEKLRLQYHVGGYSDTDEVLIVLSLDMEQININDQEYILLEQQNEKVLSGWIEIEVPDNEGKYDLTGWVIKNPFSSEKTEYIPLEAIHRFTISVNGDL